MRSWTGWHWHVTLSLFALAVVKVIRSRVAPRGGTQGGDRLIQVSVPEAWQLLRRLVWAFVPDVDRVLA